MTAPLRDGVLRSVVEIRLDDLDALDELDQMLDKINEASVKRNAIVHHAWCRDPETGAVYTHKETSRVRYESDLIQMSVDRVKSDALFVYNAGMALYTFLMKHKLLPPFPPDGRLRGRKSKKARKKRREAILKPAAVRGGL
jgi:hypothetical protein